MFSSAIKSLASNISSHYSVASVPAFQAGPWSVYDAKRRGSSNQVSVFTFDKRKLESLLSRLGSSSSAIRREVDEICDRLRTEVSFLAKLRHPAILELAEPLEEGRSAMSFVTERVTASLMSVIERMAASRERGDATENIPAARTMRENEEYEDDEVDEIEIQKGLLQLAKGLEFLHSSAGIAHLGLIPTAVFVNAKGDWKISGFGYAQDFRNQEAAEFYIPHDDQRMPVSLQFNLDYAAPELVIEHIVDPENDLFSLGCLIHALYSSRSPIHSNQNISTYKTTINESLRTVAMGRDDTRRFPSYLRDVLPRLLTRRPTDRLSSRDFQDSKYFDNILVNTIRFLDAFPAKTSQERQAFMRGLSKVLPQFPNSVLQKKILPTLIDELDKDEGMVGPILANVLEIGRAMTPDSFRIRILPGLRGMKDTPAGEFVLLDKIEIVKTKLNGNDFKEDIMPIVYHSLSSLSPSVQEKACEAVPAIAQSLDFQTIKNEMFPQVANVFSHTTSLAVKVASLLALRGLIGSGLDKYTISEKLIPLLRGMKTREPTVIMCCLEVYEPIVPMVDIPVLATEVIPHLWAMSVTPLLKIEQFKKFMTLVRRASGRVETEQTRKLAELESPGGDGTGNGYSGVQSTGNAAKDFEALVLGRNASGGLARNGKSAAANGRSRMQRLQPAAPATAVEDFEWGDEMSVDSAPTLQRPLQPSRAPSTRQTTIIKNSRPRPVVTDTSPSATAPVPPPKTQFSWQTAASQAPRTATRPQLAPQQPSTPVQRMPSIAPPPTPMLVSAPTPVSSQSFSVPLEPSRPAAEPNVWAGGGGSGGGGAMRSTSIGSVGMSGLSLSSQDGSSSAGGAYLQTLQPIGGQQNSVGFGTVAQPTPMLAQEIANPWQSVASMSSTTTTTTASPFSPPPLPPTSTNGGGFGFPQLVPQLVPSQGRRPQDAGEDEDALSKYASLL
ncbi:uncharacterized protein V1518DRAFT_409866 [Limtongia smithiae]|uniref:uncharacterized protein n=1 Tax=Limtongia smithiae TaxID=1125753 RepID=UPI0034CED677